MKLRIHHQELRFRLSEKDLDKLSTEKSLSDELSLSEEVKWAYSLTLHKSSEGLEPELVSKPLKIEMKLPETQFQTWLHGSEIEWSYQQIAPPLNILIEKDLKPHRS